MAYDSPNTRSKLIGSAASLAAFLMFAGRAQAQSYADDSSSLVDIAGLDGVTSVTQPGDGSVLVTLDTGETLTLSAGDVVIENGVVFADPSVIADAGAAAGLSINPYLIGAAAVGVGVIAAVASSDDDDGAGANNNIVLNAPPVFTSGTEASVEENTLETGFTATAQDTNGDALTFSISGGADAALFAIDANTGALSFAQAPDFEVPGDADGNNDFVVEISVTDGEFTATQTVTVTVTNINDNTPVIVSGNAVTVTENGTDAYQAEANDADGDAITFSLSGDDAALFAIDAATGLVTFIAAPDFEAPGDANGDNAYQITVTASDGTNTVSQAVTITVADQLEVIGTDGNDALTGSDDADIIDAGAGDDVIDSLQGSDQISTGTGRDILNFAGDPFEGADVSAEGRQIVGGEDFISDFDFANDAYRFDAEDFGVGGEVRFASLDANADGAAIPAGSNVIVLLNADNDGDASTPFLAGTAAAQIAALVDDAGPGFFVYWNSNLGVNRLVYSTDLSDPSADLKIVSRQTDLSGQDAIDALADFNAENFEFVSSTVVGSEAGETVLGTDEADEIFAGAGDDRIEGAGGSDIITTGTGQDDVVFAGDPFEGADVSAAGRQIVGNEDFITDFDFGNDRFNLNAADFGVEQAGIDGDVQFLALDANAEGAIVPAGTNVVVLLNSDNDANPDTPFLAGTAAAQIAELTEADGAGFFIYWNSNLGVNRLVYSTNLNDPTADLKIVARLSDLEGQDAIDALADFSAENFVFEDVDAADDTFVVNAVNDGDVIALGANTVENADEASDIATGDTIDLSNLTEGVSVDLDAFNQAALNPVATTQQGRLSQGENTVTLVDVENIIGTDFNDTLFGNQESNVILGGAGDDNIHPFGGVDFVDGGEGTDTLNLSAATGVTVDLETNTVGPNTFANFENVLGSVNGDDTLLGDSGVNVLNGRDGNDILNGRGGSDTLIGGTGADQFQFSGDPFDGADVSAEGRQIVGNEDFIEDFEFGTPTTTIEVVRASTTADVVSEAEAGNIYYNIHSTNFPAGEVRGQLELSEDNRDEAGFGSVTFTAVLNGENEVQDPPVVTEAEGTGTVTFFIAPDGSVTYETLIEINAFDDDTLTVGHFHNAPAGANGPVVVDILADARADLGSIEGGTDEVGTLAIDVTDAATTAEVLSEAEAGNIYYNIHSSNFPAGEVRGQLELVSDERDAAGYGDVTFSAILNGENEVQDPAVVTNADGDATITFTVASDGSVTYTTDIDIESFDPDTLTVGHLHNAPAGENGPVVQDILADARETTGEIAGSTVNVPALDIVVNTAATTSDVLSEAEAGNIYYNIHSSNFPAGEVRGQLVLVSDERDAAGNGDVTFTAILNGENEVQDPAVVTNADGVGNITFTVANGSVSYTTAVNIENFDIGTLTVGHLHNAPAGANGPVVQDILADAAADGSVTGSTIEQPQLDITVAETSVESSVLAEAEAGNIYFNIHSSDFPAGEVRGQLALTEDARDANGYGTVTFSAVLNGAQEVQDPAVDTFADGTGTVVFTVANDGSVTYEASVNVTDFDVARLTVGHLHNAPAGENGPVVVDLLADANATQGSIEGGEATIPTLDIAVDFAETDASVVSEAEAGNIYFNIHSSNFPAGEVRGQLELESDARDASGYGTVTFTAILNGLQEVQDPPVDTDAEGVGTVTFDIAPDGTVTYSATVDIENFDVSTLTVGHLHNAPAGENGPVVVDLLADARSPAGSIDGANEGGDVYSLNAADFGVEGDVSFLALDANADGASIAAGTNVIVLLNSDNDANPDTPFLAGTAAAQIAELTEADGAGFFIYWNSNLGVNRLVYSTNLNDASADLKIVARQTDLEGQEAIDALSSFSAENFVFEGGSEAATASLTETEEADLTQMISDLEPVDFAAEVPVELGLLSTLPSESGEVDASAGTPVGAFVGVDIDLDVDDADAAAVASQTLNAADGW
ncbi:MAG: CHRD domain-containing protein [Pseudomonadota bacterium]